MKNIVSMALFLASSSGAIAEVATITCAFTEPFFSLDLDSGEAKLTRSELNDNAEPISTVIAKDIVVDRKVVGSKAIELLVSDENQKLILKATLDYKGSNGMSDHTYPYSVIYYASESQTYFGGCTTPSLPSFDPTQLADPSFSKVAGEAISLCYARALADWTSEPSDYDYESTKFYVMYSRESVPGEPGSVSSSFTTTESATLRKLAQLTKDTPQDGADFNRLAGKKRDYCDLYGNFLHTRFATK